MDVNQTDTPDQQDAAPARRKFFKGAALAGVGAAAGYLMNFSAPRQPASPAAAAPMIDKLGRVAHAAKVSDLLDPKFAALLSPAAKNLTKGNLLDLRNYAKGKGGTVPQLTAADLNSIEAAFDARENDAADQVGVKHAGISGGTQYGWVTFGVQEAHASTTVNACCCCCPCCSTASSMTRFTQPAA